MQNNNYVLTDEDMRMIYRAANNTRDKFLAYLLYETGLRIPECATLYCSDFVKGHAAQAPYIQLKQRRQHENGGHLKTGERAITITPSLYQVYEEYMRELRDEIAQDHSYLFVSLQGEQTGEPLTTRAFSALISRWKRKTGLPLTASTFRYTHGHNYYHYIQDIRCVHKRLGHHSIDKTIQRYF